jgi:ribosomal protein L3
VGDKLGENVGENVRGSMKRWGRRRRKAGDKLSKWGRRRGRR